MRDKSLLPKAVLLLLAVVGGYLGYELNYQVRSAVYHEDEMKSHGLATEAAHTVSQCPYSLIGVIEGAFDYNEDDIVDQWSVMIRDGEPLSLIYHLNDTNGDRKPDSVSLNFNDQEFTFTYSTAEDIADEPPHRGLSFQNLQNEGELIVYHDFNFDGMLDQMLIKTRADEESELQVKALFVLFEDRWTPVIKQNNSYEVIINHDDEDTRLQFQGDKWLVADPTQQ